MGVYPPFASGQNLEDRYCLGIAPPRPPGFNWYNDYPTARLTALPYPSDTILRRIRSHFRQQ
jgi:hypothetical protein